MTGFTTPMASRRTRRMVKNVTFDGAAGSGAVGTVTLATITGAIRIISLVIRCTDSLTGATATISLGTPSDVDSLIAVTTATDLDVNEIWTGASPAGGAVAAIVDKICNENININVLVAAVDGGTIEFDMQWVPASANGNAA